MKAEAHVWLPIESAPKDGTRVTVFDPRHPRAAISVAWWSDSERDGWAGEETGVWIDGTVADWNMQEYHHVEPTHWQPLPPPPCGSEGK